MIKVVYFQNIVSRLNDIPTNPFIKSQLQTYMDKRPSRKEKGKAPVMQPKQIQKALAKISNKHEGVSIETISLQDTLLVEAMYSCGEKSEILQEVLPTDLTFKMENLQTFLFILNYFLIISKQPSPSNKNPYSQRPLRLWNYILLAPVHLLKHLAVNSLARRMEIQTL